MSGIQMIPTYSKDLLHPGTRVRGKGHFLGWYNALSNRVCEDGDLALFTAPSPVKRLNLARGEAIEEDFAEISVPNLYTSFRAAAERVRNLRSFWGDDGEDLDVQDGERYYDALQRKLAELHKTGATGYFIGTNAMNARIRQIWSGVSFLWACDVYSRAEGNKKFVLNGFEYVVDGSPDSLNVPVWPVRAERLILNP